MSIDIIDHINTSLQNYYDPNAASVIMGMTYGIKENINAALYRDIRSSGLSHLVVFSGSNIVILYSIFKGLLIPLNGKTKIFISSAILLAFLSILPMEPSTFRATIMWGFVTLGQLLHKKTNTTYIITITALCMLIFDPKYITNISFQLSFAALLGITIFNKSYEDQNGRSVFRNIQNDIKTTISAQVFTTPLIFYYFNSMNLVSVIPNLLVSITIRPILYLGLLTPILSIAVENKLTYISVLGNAAFHYFIIVVNIFKHFNL